jgi:hypothetical protein
MVHVTAAACHWGDNIGSVRSWSSQPQNHDGNGDLSGDIELPIFTSSPAH